MKCVRCESNQATPPPTDLLCGICRGTVYVVCDEWHGIDSVWTTHDKARARANHLGGTFQVWQGEVKT